MSTKKAVNLSLDPMLLERARAEGINLSSTLEKSVREKIASLDAERWRRENAEAIKHNNAELEQNGLWSDGYRLF